jgi:hypothetical protein
MRVVSEITHPSCKITVYSWNNRYIIKFEQGYLEQTYKIDQFDVASENDLSKIINENFIEQVLQLFKSMAKSINEAVIGID